MRFFKKAYKLLIYLNNHQGTIQKGIWVLKKEGLRGLRKKIQGINSLSLQYLRRKYIYITPIINANEKEKLQQLVKKPLISIIMPVYNVDSKWLDLAIKSIESQWYENWELCIADDQSTKKETMEYLRNVNNPKIKIKFLEKNLNISAASNEALTLATGEYIALMDNDDEITPDALYEVVKAINETGAEFIYSDEDFMTTSNKCVNPHFKPDFSPDLLLSHNYITHFTTFKKDLLLQIGNFNSEFDGAQDYDLFLRLTESTKKIHHISKVLYHWRMIETSTSYSSDAKPEALIRGQNVLVNTMKRRDIKANVENANLNNYFRVRYDVLNNPLVSIVIPFKDKPELLKMCIESIILKSTYQNFEILGISNNSTEQTTHDERKRLEKFDSRVKFYEYNIPFNYSQINNYAVNNYAKGNHIILLNNDIEIITPDWIESMLEHSQREEVGCVGAKLYYPNDTIQHAGVIIGLGGYAAHSHKMYNRNDYGYFNRLNIVQNLSAVTGACLMVKKSIYNEVYGLNEIDFKVAWNDVDFCLRVREAGYLNIFTPFAEAYHHESISRGYEDTKEKIVRFEKEKEALSLRHSMILKYGDPYYNPNLTLDREDFSLR
jgi:O-antigen biosynthesis protein